MGRSGKNKKNVKPSEAHQTRSQVQSQYTLTLSSSGLDRPAKVSIDGGEAQEVSGSIEVKKGASVVVSAAKATKGWQFKNWEGNPSVSVKTKCYFKMNSDISLVGVYQEKKEDGPVVSPNSGHDFVDPLGNSRAGHEQRMSEIEKAVLFLNSDGSEIDTSGIISALESGNLAEAERLIESSDLSDSAKEVLSALSPGVVSQIPEGLSPEEAVQWLTGDRSILERPAEETLPGVEAAAEMVSSAIDNGEKIAVFSDYDVDGVTSGEIINGALEANGADTYQGFASAEDGFGLNEDFVRRAHAEGCSVLITADCGSASTDAVELAQSLGMQVVVTDHHDVDESNPADHHLNQKLHMTPEEEEAYRRGEMDREFNTGSQTAWKFASEIHRAQTGEVPESHYGQPLYLAALGCRADGGNMVDLENRAFLKAREIPEGVAELATRLGEDTYSDMSDLDTTQRVLNSAKKISEIKEFDDDGNLVSSEPFSGKDVQEAIASPDPKVRAEAQEKLIRAYGRVQDLESEAKKLVRAESKSDKAMISDNGTVIRPSDESRFSHAVIEDSEMTGVSRSAAISLASDTRRPSVVFVRDGENQNGEPVYKFSAAPAPGQEGKIGPVQQLPEVQGLVEDIGGHDSVFAGRCTGSNIDQVMTEMNNWAATQPDLLPEKAPKRNMSVAWAAERKIESGAALERAERGRELLSPFTETFHDEQNISPSISVRGRVVSVRDPEPDKPRTYLATVELPDGTTREVTMQTTLAKTVPVGEELEIGLKLKAGKHSISGFNPLS